MRVLFVTPELGPWVKSGGLGEVSDALPRALMRAGSELRLLLPRYPALAAAFPEARRIASFASLGGEFAPCELLETESRDGLQLWLIDCPAYYERSGSAYHDALGREFADNAWRFGLLSRLAARLASAASPLAWRPEVVHGNDWMCGLAPAYAHYLERDTAAFVLGLHNVAFQGLFPLDYAPRLGLPAEAGGIEGVEFHGQLSFLKAGLQWADRLVAVSARYAEEIQSEAFGYGLAGLLRWRREALVGIANGIDTAIWNPARDPYLVHPYSAESLPDKAANTAALRAELGLAADATVPLLGMVTRLTWQKGTDLVADAAAQILALPAQLVVLGQGEHALEDRLQEIARQHAGAMAVHIGFDEGLAHRIEAGADIFLMPSRFEPCGLNQMYSQHYGTPPVVHEVGGLADTVVDANEQALASGLANGFSFREANAEAMLGALRRAIAAWRQPALWRRLQRQGMSKDYGWAAAAQSYLALYASAVAAKRARAVLP